MKNLAHESSMEYGIKCKRQNSPEGLVNQARFLSYFFFLVRVFFSNWYKACTIDPLVIIAIVSSETLTKLENPTDSPRKKK